MIERFTNIGKAVTSIGKGFEKSGAISKNLGEKFVSQGLPTKMAIGAGVGAAYGVASSDTSMIEGALAGAGAVGLGTLGVRGAKDIKSLHTIKSEYPSAQIISKSGRIESPSYIQQAGGRMGAAVGGALGLVSGGPVGMAVGAGIGTLGAGITKFSMRHPTAAKWGAGTAMTLGVSSAIIADSIGQARSMHRNDIGATGELTLGLHSLRHG